MVSSRNASQRQTQSSIKPINVDASAVAYAVHLIHQVCCFAGPFDLIEEFRDQDLIAAVARHDTAALFNRLMHDFSFQGISDQIAENYMARHGQATWASVRKNLAKRPTCPKLQTYWHFHACRYEKTTGTCTEPDHIAACPLPTHRLRNGHLNQIAYSLFLFIRDVADGDLISWIDDRLDQAAGQAGSDRLMAAGHALIEPLRNVYGVSDKVLAMALSALLIGADDVRPNWLQVGAHLIAVDTLVHNFLHRTGILKRLKAAHAYGPDCYRPDGCADIIARIAQEIDARAFNRTFPAYFPRFVQLAIWRYCSQQGLDICNGNRVDDRYQCQNRHCRLHWLCDRVLLK